MDKSIRADAVLVVTANRSPEIVAVTVTFLILAWVAVGLRCYVKLFMTKLFRIDDWLAIAALISFTFFCAVVLAGAAVGTGRHVYEISPQDFSSGMMWYYFGSLSYITTAALIKPSIGMFLLNICTRRYEKFIIWTVIVVTVLFSIAYFFVIALECSPVSFFWTRFIGAQVGTCLPRVVIGDMTYAHGAISAVSDWTLGVLPVFLVWNLVMNPRTKVSVALILGLGAIGSTASIVRFPLVHQLVKSTDFLWTSTDVSIWTTVEIGLGIIASSMASMRPLFTAFFSRSKLFGSSHMKTKSRRQSQLGYLRQKEIMEVDELELQPGMAKKIHVTTTVMQSKYAGRDKVDSTNSNDSERSLRGDNK